MTQRNVRGCYMNFEHDRAADWDWLSKWQPNVIRYMGGGNANDANSFDVNRVRRIHDTCPNATILLRCWAVDDNNFAAHNAMVADPRGTAERQVDWWAKVFDRANAVGVPRALLMAGLNNETGPEKDASLYPYTEFALQFATPRAVRLGVLVFSVGRPSLAGESQYDIPYFSRLDNAILANNGAVVLHQYMQPEGMYAVWTDAQGNERKDWTYLMGRDLHWNIKSPIIIGEWGIDGILYNRHPDPKYGNSGWRNFKNLWPPQRYADEYVECVRQASDNVIGICPFLSDFSDHKWQSFDLLDAYEEFLARKDLCVKEIGDTPTTPPVTVHIPSVGTGTPSTPAYIIAPAGANLRTAPITGQVITAVPYGEQIRIIGVTETGGWFKVRYGQSEGYLAASLVGLEPLEEPSPAPLPSEGPEPTPMPEPMPIATGIIDPRVAQAILRIESGGRTHGENGKPIIRFEAHIFKQQSVIDDWERFFRTDAARPWVNQEWRRSENDAWKPIHTGSQANEYAVFDFAKSLDTEGAHQSISMGAAQIMGFNFARIGYPSAQAMFRSFQDAPMQTIGFINFLLSDAKLMAAVRNKDWREIARRYNGSGAVDTYGPLLQKAYEELA